jgi:ketosteroid isomerase-like protein
MTDTRIVAQRFVDHLAAGRIVEGLSVLTEDGNYVIVGSTPVSGVYRGRQELLERLLPSLQSFVRPPVFTFTDIIVDGDHAVILASSKGEGSYDPYVQPRYAFVTRVSGDGFAEIVEFNDAGVIESAPRPPSWDPLAERPTTYPGETSARRSRGARRARPRNRATVRIRRH